MEAFAALLPEGLGVAAATLLVVASFFTSALTAAFGVGGGVAMLALMGLFVPVAALIPVHGAVQLGSNTGRAWHQRANVRMDVAIPFVVSTRNYGILWDNNSITRFGNPKPYSLV